MCAQNRSRHSPPTWRVFRVRNWGLIRVDIRERILWSKYRVAAAVVSSLSDRQDRWGGDEFVGIPRIPRRQEQEREREKILAVERRKVKSCKAICSKLLHSATADDINYGGAEVEINLEQAENVLQIKTMIGGINALNPHRQPLARGNSAG